MLMVGSGLAVGVEVWILNVAERGTLDLRRGVESEEPCGQTLRCVANVEMCARKGRIGIWSAVAAVLLVPR
jgi:hypothetical protein